MTTPLAANYPRGVIDAQRIAELRKAWEDAQDRALAYVGYQSMREQPVDEDTVRELTATVEQAQAAYLKECAR